jgi:recombinational DNA repair protein (RecF pathway)
MPKCAKCGDDIDGDPEPYFLPEFEGEVCRHCFWGAVGEEIAEHPIVASKKLLAINKSNPIRGKE